MMLAGVTATILAAATAALPFAPPSGWVQLPQSAVGVRAATWTGPAKNGAKQSFSAMVMPFPGSVDVLASKPPKSVASSGVLTQISNVPVNLCGTKGRLTTSRSNLNGTNSIIEREIAGKGGYAYMLVYARSAKAAADPSVTQLLRGFCPSGTADIPKPALPSGWVAGSDLQMAGMWMGTRPGQMMILMQGSQAPSLNQLFSSATKQTVKAPAGKDVVTISPRQPMTMCGYPGMLVDMNVNIPPMPMSMHMALTQGDGKSYVLMYTDPSSDRADPAALTALKSLCATGAAAAPSPTVSPSASASPSASVSPGPSPTP